MIYADKYGKDHSIVPINEFYLYDKWTGCYAARFFNGKVALDYRPIKINEVELRAWQHDGFVMGDRWEII